MKLVKHILLGLLILVVVLIITGFLFLNHIKKAALPDYNKNIELTGLSDEVTIYRDSFAIPHIYAKNEADLYRAIGFSMAQDRLWQMDLLRRVTQGRLSEILGKDQMNTDLLMRALCIQQKAEKILETSDLPIVSALESFAAGVNFYMANYPLPPEFKILDYQPEAWKPVHSVNLIGYMAWDLSSGWNTEMVLHQLKKEVGDSLISDLIPKMNNHPAPVFPEFNHETAEFNETLLSAGKNLEESGWIIFNGSNNWAVSGNKSKSGKPFLANDMHLGLFAPGIWYQMHQNVEGKLNVTGLVLPGQPFVIAGHNDSIAWGMTNVMVDDLDFYAETLNEDSTKYLLDGKWEDLTVKDEIIKTKEGDELNETLRFTHRGPIINRFKNENEMPLSIRWMGNEMSNEIRTVYLLNRAKNWSDFRDAVKTFISVSQNIVYADVSGNIGLQTSAGIPIRKGSGIEIYPGDTSLYDWTGMVPFENLPFEYNPERGYVSSANNKTVPGDYPCYISNWFAMPNRIDRIREMLEETEKHDIESFTKIQTDVISKKAEKFVPVFLSAVENENSWSETESAAIQKLKNWNFEMSRESQAASVFEILYRKVCENLVKDELPSDIFRSLMGERILLENLMVNILPEKSSLWIDDKTTPVIESYSAIVERSFKETIKELIEKTGENSDNWNWEKIHTITIGHPLGVVNSLQKTFNLNRGPFGVPGSYHTVCPYSYSYNNLYEVNHGASHRHIFDLNDWNAGKTVIPTGTSGIPSSKFYLDQTKIYLHNRYHTDPFSNDYVQKLAQFKMKLLPE